MIIGGKSNDAGLPSKEKVVTQYPSPDELNANSSSSQSSSVSSSEQPNLPKTGGDEQKIESKTINSWILPTALVSVALGIIAFAGYKYSSKKKS